MRGTKTQEAHAARPPKLTAVRWCRKCSRRHSGHCDIVPVVARNREGHAVGVPHWGRTPRRNRRRVTA